jgi:hypothetical protein
MLMETFRKPDRRLLEVAVGTFVGVALGLGAQLLRQLDGPLMSLGAATAPWLTIGFILSLWASRATTRVTTSSLVGVATMATYLFAWLASYHTLFAIRESVTGAEAWQEAAPWAIAAIPTSLILGLVAALTPSVAIARIVSLAFPLALAFPELLVSLGWAHTAVIGVPALAFTILAAVILEVDRRALLHAGIAGAALAALAAVHCPSFECTSARRDRPITASGRRP